MYQFCQHTKTAIIQVSGAIRLYCLFWCRLVEKQFQPGSKPWLAERCADNAMSPCPLPTSPSEENGVYDRSVDTSGCRWWLLRCVTTVSTTQSIWSILRRRLLENRNWCRALVMEKMTRHKPFHNDVLMCQFQKIWKSKSRCVGTRTHLRTQQYFKIWNAP